MTALLVPPGDMDSSSSHIRDQSPESSVAADLIVLPAPMTKMPCGASITHKNILFCLKAHEVKFDK